LINGQCSAWAAIQVAEDRVRGLMRFGSTGSCWPAFFPIRVLRSGLLIVVVALLASFMAGSVIASQGGFPVIAAAGDLACDPANPYFNGGNGTANGCAELRTTNQLAKDSTVDRVLGLGDVQYYCDEADDYDPPGYNQTWGRFESKTYPVAGNHEYSTGQDPYGDMCPSTNTTAQTFFSLNSNSHPPNGYYSFDLGTSWHLIALNANCSSVGGCGASSPETRWLTNDLNTTTKTCILAYWHQPRWTGTGTNNSSTSTWWNLLYQKHVDVVLNGHVHNYQRFPQLDPNGNKNSQGIREVIVGTGGESLQSASSTATPQPEVALKVFGYLKMVLQSSSYQASFVDTAGHVLDSWSTTCH
jgi:acid phosphatase type 7